MEPAMTFKEYIDQAYVTIEQHEQTIASAVHGLSGRVSHEVKTDSQACEKLDELTRRKLQSVMARYPKEWHKWCK